VTRLAALVATTLALIPLACGGNGSGATTAAAQATSASASFPAELRGTWTRELTQADIDRTASNRDAASEAPPLGVLTLILNDGIMQVTDETGFTISEELIADADGSFLLRRYLGGEGAFCENSGPADYTWSRDGDTVTIKSAEGADLCADRDTVVAGTWTKSG
jgi:hypothetical protein